MLLFVGVGGCRSRSVFVRWTVGFGALTNSGLSLTVPLVVLECLTFAILGQVCAFSNLLMFFWLVFDDTPNSLSICTTSLRLQWDWCHASSTTWSLHQADTLEYSSRCLNELIKKCGIQASILVKGITWYLAQILLVPWSWTVVIFHLAGTFFRSSLCSVWAETAAIMAAISQFGYLTFLCATKQLKCLTYKELS